MFHISRLTFLSTIITGLLIGFGGAALCWYLTSDGKPEMAFACIFLLMIACVMVLPMLFGVACGFFQVSTPKPKEP